MNTLFVNHWNKNWNLVKFSPYDHFVASDLPHHRYLMLFTCMNSDDPRQDSKSCSVFTYPLILPFFTHALLPRFVLQTDCKCGVLSGPPVPNSCLEPRSLGSKSNIFPGLQRCLSPTTIQTDLGCISANSVWTEIWKAKNCSRT